MKSVKKVISMMLSVLLIIVLLIGCGKEKSESKETSSKEASESKKTLNDASDKKDKQWTVVIMPKLVGIPYFNAAQAGAEQAGKDFGVDVIYTGPTTTDAAAQVNMLEDLIVKGVDAICVSADDANALSPVLQKAKQAGILVMDWDSPANPEDVEYSIVQVDYELYAKQLWDVLVQYMGSSGKYAILTGGLGSETINNWIKIGTEYAKEKYPDLELVCDIIPTNEVQQEAYERTLELIKAYPDLNGIVALSSPAPIGAAQAIREKELQDKIVVVGTALPNDVRDYFKDGSIDGSEFWDPTQFGTLCVYLAKQMLNGEKIVDGENVPGVGNIEVRPDGKTIIMAKPIIFDINNIDDYDF